MTPILAQLKSSLTTAGHWTLMLFGLCAVIFLLELTRTQLCLRMRNARIYDNCRAQKVVLALNDSIVMFEFAPISYRQTWGVVSSQTYLVKVIIGKLIGMSHESLVMRIILQSTKFQLEH